MNEIEWKVIEEWPDYQIGSNGEVRRLTPSQRTRVGMKIKSIKDKFGYHTVWLYRKGVGKRVKIHRLVAFAFLGAPPSCGYQVAHGDGNKDNNNICNLRWATPKENQNDRVAHGTHSRGENSGTAKLNRHQVMDIRARYSSGGVTQSDLGKEFGVSRRQISNIVRKVKWI